MKFSERICTHCGKLYMPTSGRQKYCKGEHYLECPVCYSRYLVQSNSELSYPARPCSVQCKKANSRISLRNSSEAQSKHRATTYSHFGVEYPMQSSEVRNKALMTLRDKYGVDNISQVKSVVDKAHANRNSNWIQKVHELLPLRIEGKEESPHFIIDESQMGIYILREEASVAFLTHYGFRIRPKFARKHYSLGLVQDGVLYQVIRFEGTRGQVKLADFGVRTGYFNPNYYNKLMNYAIQFIGFEDFICEIPRHLATPQVIQSLSIKKVDDGDYEVYWKVNEGLRKLTQRDDIEDMLSKYDYITSDYLDHYNYSS